MLSTFKLNSFGFSLFFFFWFLFSNAYTFYWQHIWNIKTHFDGETRYKMTDRKMFSLEQRKAE